MWVGVFCTGKRGWVGTENAFFICFGMNGHHLPHPRRSLYTPPVETPAPSAPGRTAQHRQQRRPCQIQGRPPTTGHTPAYTPGHWTRCTCLHSMPDRPRRVDRDDGGAGGQKPQMLHTQHFCMLVRLILVMCYRNDCGRFYNTFSREGT